MVADPDSKVTQHWCKQSLWVKNGELLITSIAGAYLEFWEIVLDNSVELVCCPVHKPLYGSIWYLNTFTDLKAFPKIPAAIVQP